MKLYFDEDMGKGIAEALASVGVKDVTHAKRQFHYRFEQRDPVPDEDWLTFCGQQGFIGISCNTGILEAEGQRETLIAERAGIIFITTGRAKSFDILRLLLRRWEWFDAVARNQPRPFAYLVSLTGPARLDPRVHP